MSSINPNNINGSYPIAGQDNDSQGFRDNFTNVKNNLTFAKTEIEDIQNNAILKTGLAGTTLNNEMNYAQLKGAQLIKTAETIKDWATQTSVEISFADGHYQKVTTGGAFTISAFTNWPTSGLYAKLRLEIVISTSATDTVTLPNAVSGGLTNIQGAVGQTITFPAAGSYVFEFTTYNAGTTITIDDLTRNKDNITGSFTTTGVITVNSSNAVTAIINGGTAGVGNIGVSSATRFNTVFATSLSGNLTTAAQAAITSVGTLTALAVSGATTVNSSNAVTAIINGGTTGVGNIGASGAGFNTVFATSLSGNLTTAAQTNITSVGTLTALAVTGNVTISSNLIVGGGQIITGHQYSIAITGFDDVTGVNVSRVIYNPAGTLANGRLTLPLGNVEAKIITVSSSQAITAFQVLPNAGTTLTPSANITLAAGTSVSYFYKTSIPGWLKIG